MRKHNHNIPGASRVYRFKMTYSPSSEFVVKLSVHKSITDVLWAAAQHRMKNDFDFYHRTNSKNERLLFSPSFLRLSRQLLASHDRHRIRLKEHDAFALPSAKEF